MYTQNRIPTEAEASQTWQATQAEQRARLSGLLLTMAFSLLSLGAPSGLWMLAWSAAGLTSFAGFTLLRYPRLARALATIGLGSGLALGADTLRQAPTTSLAAFLVAVGLLAEISQHSRPISRPGATLIGPHAVRGAAIGALFTLLVAGLLRSRTGVAAGFVVVSLVLVLVLGWSLWGARGDWIQRLFVILLVSLGVAYANVLRPHPVSALTILGLGLVLVLLLVRDRSVDEPSHFSMILDHPARLVVATFAALCVSGTILLALPTSGEERPIALINAAFTAVSAVCVTGLSVVDTASSFSFSGELILVTLIQLGGLGIMALYTTAFGLFGRRLSIRHEHAVASAQSVEQVGSLFRALATLVLATVGIEALGALALLARFSMLEPFDVALWKALFHAVSAFCNAGFALQADNLVTYAADPWILHTIGTLIVLGGLSPAVIASIPLLWGRRHKMTAQARIGLAMTALLLVAGFVMFLAFEWSNTLGHLSTVNKLHNAWFQSITPRTAGFNSIDYAKISPPTRLLTIVLMFIGGCPGGTAGGIKTTTTALLTLAVVAVLRGRNEVSAFGYRFPLATVGRATAIATLGIGTVIFFTLALLLTQNQAFDALLFEVVSALGTVGLTMGVTGNLDHTGKILIMACMFIGRVGPLTVLVLLSGGDQASSKTLPEQDVQVG